MAEDERRAKLWMLLIDCLFYCFFSCVIHHQYPGLLQGGGRVWFSCMNVAFLLFPLNFPLSLSSDTFLWKHISNFDRATKIFTARRKLSLLWKLPSNHVTLFTGPHEKLSKTVGRMHGSHRGVTEALLKQICQQLSIVSVGEANCSHVRQPNL